MPCVSTGVDRRPRTPQKAGARPASRLDRDPPRSLRGLWQDLHFLVSIFSAVYPLQLAGALLCVAAQICGALPLGTGGPSAQGSQSCTRCFYTTPLVERPGPVSTGAFLFAPDDCSHCLLAEVS